MISFTKLFSQPTFSSMIHRMIHRNFGYFAGSVVSTSFCVSAVPPLRPRAVSSSIQPRIIQRVYSQIAQDDVIGSETSLPKREEESDKTNYDAGKKLRWSLLGMASLVGIGSIAVAGKASGGADMKDQPEVCRYPTFVRERLQATYMYVAGGLGVASCAAILAINSSLYWRLLTRSPLLMTGGFLVLVNAAAFYCNSTSYHNNLSGKMLAYGSLCTISGVIVSSLVEVGGVAGSLLFFAVIPTSLIVGSISLVAANTPSYQFFWMGGPLTVGLGVVLCASIGQIAFPGLPMFVNVAVYGGLGVFGVFQFYDVHRIQQLAMTQVEYDPIDQSISVFLNIINIFFKIVEILELFEPDK